MAQNPTRRTVLTAAGTSSVLALAGCIGTTGDTGSSANQSTGRQSATTSPLRAGGSSTVYPVTSKAEAVWTSNPPADDEEYWGPSQYGIDTDERLADYWAGLYGFESSADGSPPFDVTVGLSHSGTGLERLRKQQLDIGDSSAPVEAEFPDVAASKLEKFTDHVVGVDAQPIVVSKAVYETGVDQLTAGQVRAIYRGEITNWSEIDRYGGPDREIQAVGRSVGSGTDTAFRANMLGDPDAEMPGVDARKGQNQQVETIVANSDNAIAYMALAFVSAETPAVELSFDGTVYQPGKNLADENYPLSRDLHCYTWDGTSKKEAAYLRLILSDFGQTNFVGPAGYAALTDTRQDEELGNLPEPTK